MSSYHWNRPAEMTVPGGSTRTLEYDPLMRIGRITDKDPGQNVVMDYQYTYDKMDNIVGKSTEHGDYAYGYDDLHRLTTVDNPNFSDEAFSYDPVGNRLTSAGISGNWSYNGNNELLGYDGISYEYDANGNTIQKNDNGIIAGYSYDIEERLVEVTTNNPQPITYRYYYDPFGRRLWKEVDGTRTYFMYSDEGLIAELDSSGNITKSYGYKPNSTWTTDPLFMKVGTDYYFYHNDHLGTPHKLTAINGSVVWSAKYSSFGGVTIDPDSTITNNLRFPGQCYDQETGLHYNWHRNYDPRTGRYLEMDPLKKVTLNKLYLYVQHNPINLHDPYGLIIWRELAAGVGLTIAGVAVMTGGGALTYALLVGEHALAVPTLGASFLLTPHAIGLGGTIIAIGGVITKIGIDTIIDAIHEDSRPPAKLAGESPGKPCK